MAEADVNSKWLLGKAPETWVRWLLDDPSLAVEAHLSGEFQHVLRHSDVLLQVRGRGEPFLVLTELQLHPDPRMPQRMRAYTALAEEKYDLPVYPVVVYLLPPKSRQPLPECYHREFLGLMAHQDFRVVKIWELDAKEILRREILSLVPFVPLMKGADEETIKAGVELIRRKEAGEEMEMVLAFFASFVMEPELISKIVRWDMAVIRESPWYQQILQEGYQEGIQQGIQQGMQKGLYQGLRDAILELMRNRFGLSDGALEKLSQRLERIQEPQTLKRLVVEAAQAESLEAFERQLPG